MNKQANPKLVGAFVLGAAALLVAAVILLADGGFWRDRPSYIMYFEGSTTGLQVGSLAVLVQREEATKNLQSPLLQQRSQAP